MRSYGVEGRGGGSPFLPVGLSSALGVVNRYIKIFFLLVCPLQKELQFLHLHKSYVCGGLISNTHLRMTPGNMVSPELPAVNGDLDYEIPTPSTPPRTGLSLTEYSSNPSPPPRHHENKSKLGKQLGEDFILPNGYPDVSQF